MGNKGGMMTDEHKEYRNVSLGDQSLSVYCRRKPHHHRREGFTFTQTQALPTSGPLTNCKADTQTLSNR